MARVLFNPARKMRHCYLLVIAMAIVSQPAGAQTTLTQRVDMSREAKPYYTAGVVLENGWELWGFGYTHAQTADLEVGKLIPVGEKLFLGGYGVLWPDSGKVYLLPWAVYTDRVLGGTLSLNLATYLPLNGGPRILFSDNSTLVWRDRRGNGIGLSGALWSQEGTKPTLRIGPQLELVYRATTLKVNYQPLYLTGSGPGVARIEVVQKF
jgi:hypothetical protein